MATAETKLLTAEEFWDFLERLENQGKRFELENGEVVEMPSPAEFRGIPMVWVVDDEVRTVTVYRPGQEPLTLDDSDELLGGDVLPDFRCRIADLFTLPGA